jgi:hypothetical protein
MSHYHRDFSSEWTWDFPAFDADTFARVPRAPRDRPPRPGGDGDGSSGGSGGGATPSGPYTSGDLSIPDTNEYNVQVVFKGNGWTAELRQAFISAADAISDFILGDVPTVGVRRSSIDDISITASLTPIDGPGYILGQAGWTAVRAGSFLPYKGIMEFDVDDVNYYLSLGLFDDIVLHEMLHVVGLGTIWSQKGLLSGTASAPTFNGALANAVYPGSLQIPVENSGGSGTAYSHWEEDVFDNELMTGYIDSDNTLSYMTIASLGDLGYSVVSGASYVPPTFI